MPQSESFSTSTKAGGRTSIVDRDAASVRAHARVSNISIRDEAFFDKYLQPLGDGTLPTTKVWEKLKQKVIKDFKGRNESKNYVSLASILNEMSCVVHRKVYACAKRQKFKGKATSQENVETCILLRDTNNLAPRGVENLRIRPDPTATKADYQTTKRRNENCEFEDYPDEKCIHEVLNDLAKEWENKEVKGGTIDLDNGEDLDETEGCNKTDRTGTRTYVAIPVAEGKCHIHSIRPSFTRYPELSGEALRLYIEAYGEETYRHYIEEFYKSPSELVDYSAPFRQLPVHDAESIIWIILDFLLKAIPEGGNPEVTRVASSALKVLVNHTPEPSADSRRCFREFFSREWLHSLHPKLSHLAPMLCEFSSLLDFNWTLLCIKGLLPQDILHEAVKRVFLQEIVHIRTERCDVRLELEIRRPLVWVPKTIGASPSTKRKSVSVVESTSKRTRYD